MRLFAQAMNEIERGGGTFGCRYFVRADHPVFTMTDDDSLREYGARRSDCVPVGKGA